MAQGVEVEHLEEVEDEVRGGVALPRQALLGWREGACGVCERQNEMRARSSCNKTTMYG